ncbi:hypothetical protein [Bartonella sp. AR 15-3]|uniref:hypothetical protein n=1 Tax=Bartonella sp. AR 15-3 TaxID=545617 RepID=UPI0001F4C93D|nr:hypothetical protein [Bartonella sp. AR 15-3]OPB31928.1 hypothetical protein BAR153v2_008900 [Bartonella sp. AR 15-3]CBI79034.1 conserved hypothetical protein [Bartonella sp. AR 15-3]
MEVVNGMEQIGEKFEKQVSLPLSSFLTDFSSRYISPEDIEILPFDNESKIIHNNEKQEDFSSSNIEFSKEYMEEILSFDLSSEGVVDVEAVRKEAVDQAVQEVTEKLQKQFEVEKKCMEEEHAKAIEAVKQGFIETLGANVQHQLTKGFTDLRQEISQEIAQILSIFIGEKITEDALQEFATKVLDQALAVEKPLVLEGNEALFEQLKKQRDFDAAQFEFRPTKSTEIRLHRGEVVIATQLTPLLMALKELIQ